MNLSLIYRLPVLEDNDTSVSQEVVDNRTLRSVLQINNSQPSDDALYTCVAWNNAGSDEASAQLTVFGTYCYGPTTIKEDLSVAIDLPL